MKFSTKIFLITVLNTVLFLGIVVLVVYQRQAENLVTHYAERYQVSNRMVGDTLNQLESASDRIAFMAAQKLQEVDRKRGLLPLQDLVAFTKEHKISQACIIDNQGRFIRDTVAPNGGQPQTLFQLCEGYRELIKGGSNVETTPIVPSIDGSYKFTMIPNHNRTRILEVGIHVDYLFSTLAKAVQSDPNLQTLALYSPSGLNLGGTDVKGQKLIGNKISAEELKPGYRLNGDKMVMVTRVSANNNRCCECQAKQISAAQNSDEYYYLLRTEISTAPLKQNLNALRNQLIGTGIGAGILSAALAYFFALFSVQRLRRMKDTVNRIIRSGDLSSRLKFKGRDEVSTLALSFDQMIESLETSQQKALSVERDRALGSLARQVAHDIRSPLVALKVIEKDLSSVPEESRVLLRHSIERIQDIAHSLMKNSPQSTTAIESEKTEAHLVSALIDSLISEKRVQFRSRPELAIHFRSDETSYGLFCKLSSAEFKRTLSNLLNNAAEAIENSGQITVTLQKHGDFAFLTIEDNGKGIPADLIPRLGERGLSVGKDDGSGLGLHAAKASLTSWGGRLHIDSQEGRGTTVSISLPLTTPPAGFLSEIQIQPDTQVVITDDDSSIRQIWRQRFAGLTTQIVELQSPQELREWITHQNSKTDRLFLMDYEFLDSEDTGLGLIQELDLASQSILVTSRHEENELQIRCNQVGITLFPKALAATVPIRSKL
ncbi:HAMP domain-containing histidine kinase [bacterium]|nr:HAMP domain-containing histidine kinase [bacterium]